MSCPPVNLNGPAVARAAEKAGLTVPEFVEFCVLFAMSAIAMQPGRLDDICPNPAERLEALRASHEFVRLVSKLPPFERRRYAAEFPHLNINTEE